MSTSNLTTKVPSSAKPANGFSLGLKRTFIVTFRVLNQLRHDRRYLALSLIAPLLLVFFLKIFFDTMEGPGFVVSRFIVPIGAFLIMFLTYIICAVALVRERKDETLSRMFVNGFRRMEIIVGYLLAYSLLATIQALIVLIELALLFNLGYSLEIQLSIYLIMWLLAVTSVALGIFLSNFARNEGQVLPTIPMIIVPSVFFSGMLAPIDKIPDWIQWISRVTPLYYSNNVIQKLIKPGGSLGDDVGSLLGLVTFGVVVMILASLTLRERD